MLCRRERERDSRENTTEKLSLEKGGISKTSPLPRARRTLMLLFKTSKFSSKPVSLAQEKRITFEISFGRISIKETPPHTRVTDWIPRKRRRICDQLDDARQSDCRIVDRRTQLSKLSPSSCFRRLERKTTTSSLSCCASPASHFFAVRLSLLLLINLNSQDRPRTYSR